MTISGLTGIFQRNTVDLIVVTNKGLTGIFKLNTVDLIVVSNDHIRAHWNIPVKHSGPDSCVY